MNARRSRIFFRLLAFTVLLSLTAACSNRVGGPTTGPKAGHWAYQNGTHGEPDVSFALDASGAISDFSMTTSLGTPKDDCELKADQVQMTINNDGTFVLSYSMGYADLEKQVGPAVLSLLGIPEGKPYEVLEVSGKATDTALNGTYKITVCGPTVYFAANTGPWRAAWKNP